MSPEYCADCQKTTGLDCGKHHLLMWPLGGVLDMPPGKVVYYPSLMTPYKCPVCNGTALVSFPPGVAGDASWTGNNVGPWVCPACEKGIIWK